MGHDFGMTEKIIGHGTWYDKRALEVIERERKLGRSLDLIRTEMGFGASGIPHVGNVSDAIRSYAMTVALQAQNHGSELIAFCDDKDGLRKVPTGFPQSLRKFLGFLTTLSPVAAGTYTDMEPHPSTSSNYQNVDETYPDSDITYKSATADEDGDTYTFAALSLGVGAVAYSVANNYVVRNSLETLATGCSYAKSAATESEGTVFSIPTSYRTLQQVYNFDIDSTTRWSEQADPTIILNACEWGFRRKS